MIDRPPVAGIAKALTAFTGLLFSTTLAAQIPVSKTWTTDADFDQGTMLNVNHNAPNNNQLQLNRVTAPLPFVYVACSGRGSIVRIDVNTGAVLGEYWTAPDGRDRNPSRTTVDQFGNCWVGNRDEASTSGGVGKGSVVRIGIVIGGRRVNANRQPDPNGLYLEPPFTYNTCVDRDQDGLIKTSLGLGSILPWSNAGGADNDGGVSTAEDECIQIYTRTAGTNVRTVAVDGNNDLWCGGTGNLSHEKLSGVTGQPIAGTQFNVNCGGYGGLLDAAGVLWSARINGLLRYDTATSTPNCLGYGDNYGLGIDPATGNIWSTVLSGNAVRVISPSGVLLGTWSHGNHNAQGLAVDGSGNVWVAHSLVAGQTTVGHLRTDGTFVGNVNLPGGQGPTGVAVDSNGKVWVANYSTNNAMRIDPTLGPAGGGGFPVGEVDMTVPLGSGASPYNYSDMTGFVAIGTTSPQGIFDAVWDSGQPMTNWTRANWASLEPPGTSVSVEVRAAETQIGLTTQAFVPVVNNVPFGPLTGQFVEVRVTLQRAAGNNTSPVLYDVRISGDAPECYLFGGLTPGYWQFTNDVLLVDQIMHRSAVTTASVPAIAIPNNANLLGMRAYLQVWMYNPTQVPGDPFMASSGLEVTVGGTGRTYGPSSGINIRLRHPALVGGTVQADFSFQ